jgi:zinc transporter ZupT
MLALFWVKMVVTVTLLVLTILVAFVPWLINHFWCGKVTVKNWMRLMTCMAGGVIMGALLFHLIPEFLPHPHDHSLSDAQNFSLREAADGTHDSSTIHADHQHEAHEAHEAHENHNACKSSQSGKQAKASDDAHKAHAESSHDDASYKWGALAAGLSFFFLLGIDRFFLSHYHCSSKGDDMPSTPVIGLKHPAADSKRQQHADALVGEPIHFDSHYIHGLAECAQDASHKHHQHHQQHHSMSSRKSQIDCKEQLDDALEHDLDPLEMKRMNDLEAALSKKSKPDIFEDGHSSCHSNDVIGGCHMDGIRHDSTQLQSVLFVSVLSVHSFLEGLAMHSIASTQDLISFSFSMYLHKLLEAFALGMNVYKADFERRHYILLILLYSVLTPLGILFSMLLYPMPLLVQVLNGLAAGSFLYVACIEMIVPEFHKPDKLTPYKFIALLFGFGLVALGASFSPTHAH